MNWKNSAVEEGKRIPSQSKQREGQTEKRYFCVASCNNNAIFVGFSLICLESLGFL